MNTTKRMNRKSWRISAIIIWSAFITITGLQFYVGNFSNTPSWAKVFNGHNFFFVWVGLFVAGIFTSSNARAASESNYTAYKNYKTVGEWWEKEGSKFPIQVPSAISKLQKEKGMSFQEAFEYLLEKRVIIPVDDAK